MPACRGSVELLNPTAMFPGPGMSNGLVSGYYIVTG